MSGNMPPSGPGPTPAPQLVPTAPHQALHPTPYHQPQHHQPLQQQHIQPQHQHQHHLPPQPVRQPSQQQQQLEAAAMKLTRGTSCVLCQQRKVRCDKNKPCANCVKAGVECRVVPPQPPRRRKKRLQERDLIDRLKKYEALLSENGVKFDAINQDLKSDGHQPPDDVDELENDFEGLKTSPENSTSPSAADQEERSGLWHTLHKEFRASEQLLHDSSDEEIEGSNIYRAFDRMFDNQDGFPFIVGGRTSSVTDAHPSAIHILQFWQIYIDNINPLLKITHVPSIQGQVIEATSKLEKTPKNLEALMFGIYVMAITSLEESDVQRMFDAPKKELLGRYFVALQQSLVNASFMRMNDPISLQAYLLYLLAVRWFVDPRQIFCLIGVAVRIAQRMGLHRDPGGYGLPPFEVEQRRRLWWTIVAYDRRIGEMTGSTVTALSTGSDCKLPLNVNDSDLHVDGKELPTPHTGPTEMLFALTRVELAMCVASNSNRDSFKMNNPDKGSPPASTETPSIPSYRLAGQDGPSYTLEGFAAHIEGTYLKQCDVKVPLHFFTLTMTRQALCKMRVINFLVRMHNSEAMPLRDIERDDLFLQATQMIEYDNVVWSSDSLRPFRWFAMHHFPFPAYMFIINELRIRCAGPGVERAWDAIAKNCDLRNLLSNLHSPMHMAFGGHFVKAWDAHAAAMHQAGRQPTEPRFLGFLRERAERKRRLRREDPAADPGQPAVDFPRPPDASPDGGAPPSSDDGGPANMMTPPVDPAMAAMGGSRSGGAVPSDDGDNMDWSYMYPNMNQLNPFSSGALGGYGGPMGGMDMGGMGGMGGGNMFGS